MSRILNGRGLGIAAVLAAVLASGQVSALEFGTFSLKAHETGQVDTGPTYRNLRVCNDAESAGTVIATIGDHQPHVLLPGVCAEDLGNSIVLQNQAAGPARGTYRPIPELPYNIN